MLKEYNENNIIISLMHGYYINEFMTETKKAIKQKKVKKVYYKPVRQQIQFGKNLDISFIKNKQNYLSDIRERLEKFSPDNMIKFITSDTIKDRYVSDLPDIIVDITGIIAAKHEELSSIYTNINTMFFINPMFKNFINQDFKQMVNNTDVPYFEKFFLIDTHNADRFFSSMIFAFGKIFPDKHKELFSEYGFTMVWEYINLSLICYQNKIETLKTDENLIDYLNAFINYYFTFDAEILEYTKPFRPVE